MSVIDFEVHDTIAVIRFNRPDQRNAVNNAVAAELRDALKRLESDDTLRIAILTGAGKIFCAGMDLGAFAAGERPGLGHPDRFAHFVGAERTKPIIAAVNGGAYAGGFEIMLACDMVVAAEGAMFGVPEVKRGLMAAGGGVIRLPRRLPPAIANEMILTGDPISAERALGFGLVNSVVPGDKLMDAAMDLAKRVAVNAPFAVRASLQVARAASGLGEAELWARNERFQNAVEQSEDALEGSLAFKEKRTPVWKGR